MVKNEIMPLGMRTGICANGETVEAWLYAGAYHRIGEPIWRAQRENEDDDEFRTRLLDDLIFNIIHSRVIDITTKESK